MANLLMDIVFDSSLALLAIIVPLGVAYIVLFFQSRYPDYGYPKALATTGDELQHERSELSRAEKRQAVRLMKHWLF